MRILILGAAAGGGFPQWNCNHPNSRRARQNDPQARPRTQSSIAVTADGARYLLCNAAPDLRQQINDNPALHPRFGLRHSPISAVALTNADVDHVAGLLNLRESQAFALYATTRVLKTLAANSIFNVLNPDFVARRAFTLEETVALTDARGEALGLWLKPFAVPGKVALWLEDPQKGDLGTVEEDTIAYEISDGSGAHFFYIPACAAMTDGLAHRIQGAPLVLFDGTLWRDDELIQAGVGHKTGQRMGHLSLSGEGGTLAAFADLQVQRKVLVHLNTTNPVLLDDSPERAFVESDGWEVAFDGMEITLEGAR
ncbi:MAG: pyrroloquinoline quinone biosynthesis protein PqqB [Candidatus Competibacterales bacterium]